MDVSVFEYVNYKKYLNDRIESFPKKGRGIRRLLAEAAGCQVAYISHVLVGERDLSLEQAEAIARFLNLRADETEFFILLLERARSGTEPLRKYFDRQIQRLTEAHRAIKNRVSMKGQISLEDQAIYYSSWHYQAIRMALTIPSLRNPTSLAKKLNLPIERVNDVLDFFLRKGMIKETPKGYVTTDLHIHVGNDSELIGRMHANWRAQMLQVFDRKNSDDLHYSAAVTLAAEDYMKIREILLKAITDSHKIIRPSKEEKLCVMALDFYEL